jgi:hypothetical protein
MWKETAKTLAIGIFGLLTAMPASAQDTATLALRSGERPSGQLIDMNARGFILNINGQERVIPAGEVVAVEFVVGPPPADAQARINAGQPVVVMRSGQVIDGRLSDVGGTSPLRLTVDTASGPRDFNSSDVAQIYVNPVAVSAASGQAATAATPAPIPAGAFSVPANQAWTDTGISVRRRDRLIFTAVGDVMISPSASSGIAGSPAVTNPAARYPVQGAPAGALVGRIGNGTPFLIGGNAQPIEVNGTGKLFLGVNDDQLADNSGEYHVSVRRP